MLMVVQWNTAAAVTSDPPSKTASEADDKTKHKIIRLKPSATALQDRRVRLCSLWCVGSRMNCCLEVKRSSSRSEGTES
jgi:hypothetical protein